MPVAPSRTVSRAKARGVKLGKKIPSAKRAAQSLRSAADATRQDAAATSGHARPRKRVETPGGDDPACSPGVGPLPYRLDPARAFALQSEYLGAISALWRDMLDGKPAAVSADKRFRAEAWTGLHAYLAEFYLLNS